MTNATTDTFRALHAEGIFAMPNPWDRGTARTLEAMGFKAVATTSAGFGRAIGKDDYAISRDELVDHVADLTSVLTIPLNVDSEQLFPNDDGGIAETVRLLADAGAAGCSIEDFDPARSAIDPIDVATGRVAEAVAACAEHDLVLTARAENHLHGAGGLDDTIERLVAYRDAGAEVVYAPGLSDEADIERVVTETGIAVNVLAMPNTPSLDALGSLGVRRMSAGSGLYIAAQRAFKDAATAFAGE